MPISEGFKDIEVWASDPAADRTDPEDASLTPPLNVVDGWGATFSQADGDVLRRAVWNMLMYRLTSAAVDIRGDGIPAWDTDVDTNAGGVKQVSGVLYKALVANGPGSSNAASPTAVGQTVWEEISGTLGPPSAPAAPQASASKSGQLDWFWNCPLDGGALITEFQIRWRTAGTLTWNTAVTVNYPHYVLTSLPNGTAIEAQVLATNSQGSSVWSLTGTATPSGVVPGGGPTFALRADPGDTETDLDWLEPDDGGVAITSYTAQWRTDGQVYSSSREASVMSTTHTVTGLTNGTLYHFQVRAVNSEGNGTWSNEASATPMAAVATQTIPDRANAPTGTGGNGQATWVAFPPSDNGSDLTGYEFRWRATGGSWATVATSLPVLTRTGLTNGTAYEAQVRATNGVGQQTAWSPSGTATPSADVPDQIQQVALENTSTGIRASWGEPDDNGASVTTYRAQIDDNTGFSSPQTFNQTGRTRTFTGLSEATTYYVRVRATNSAGNGTDSPTASLAWDDGVSVPDAPGTPSGTARRPLLINWTWSTPDQNGDAIDDYDFQWRVAGNNWSGNLTTVTEGSETITISATTAAIEGRVRANNSDGAGSWSSTGSVAAADLLGAVQSVHEFTSPQTFTWPYTYVTRCVLGIYAPAAGNNPTSVIVNGVTYSDSGSSFVSGEFEHLTVAFGSTFVMAGPGLNATRPIHIFPQPDVT